MIKNPDRNFVPLSGPDALSFPSFKILRR
jgi:hypothetical protein